jgi:hypothetical protein
MLFRLLGYDFWVSSDEIRDLRETFDNCDPLSDNVFRDRLREKTLIDSLIHRCISKCHVSHVRDSFDQGANHIGPVPSLNICRDQCNLSDLSKDCIE